MSDVSAAQLFENLKTWRQNLVTNTRAAFTGMKPEAWIRLIVIVGAYCLIRPYLLKMGARHQEKQHERDAAAVEAEKTDANIHPNEVRTGKKYAIPGADDDSGEEEEKGADWGKKARVRQRKFIEKTLAKQEQRLADEQEESDKELEDLLIK